MCRFLIFQGRDPILLAHLLTRPAHSIINQSFDSRLRIDQTRPINGDGFGVGYYCSESDPEFDHGPCLFRAITPAWNNTNLAMLSEKTKSSLVFAHVRASTSAVLSETNCHPFSYHTLMFMHNGCISSFGKIKKRLATHVDDKYFLMVQGATDSEWAFALFLDCLDKLGVDPSSSSGGFGHTLIRKALLQTIAYINEWTKHEEEPNLLNFAVTDGKSVVVTRYISSKTEEAASLHFSSGTKFLEYEPGKYRMERRDRCQDVIMVASEPLTFERSDWVTIPTNTVLTIHDQNIFLHPVIDEYYQPDPTTYRSSTYALSKGLVGPVPIAESNLPDVPPLEREGRRRSIMT